MEQIVQAPAEPQMPRNCLPTDFNSGIHEVGNYIYKETTEGKTNHETDCMDAGISFAEGREGENREERGGCEAWRGRDGWGLGGGGGAKQKGVNHTPTLQRGIAFWYLPPNSARTGYATEGALFIGSELVTPLKGHSLSDQNWLRH